MDRNRKPRGRYLRNPWFVLALTMWVVPLIWMYRLGH